MEVLKNVALAICVSLFANILAAAIRSGFIGEFVDQTLILVLVSLFAINTTTTSVIMTKLKELSEKYELDFSASIHQLRLALIEQVGAIGIAVAASIFRDSEVLAAAIPFYVFAMDVILFATFGYVLLVLYDLANAIFVILRLEP